MLFICNLVFEAADHAVSHVHSVVVVTLVVRLSALDRNSDMRAIRHPIAEEVLLSTAEH